MKTAKLHKLTPQNGEMLTNLHDDIFDTCVTLLDQHRYFIIEDAIIRANKRKLRDDIQWPVILKWLEEHFGTPIAAHHRASLKRMAGAAFNPLRVTKDVRKALDAGNGNQTAGYGFLGWPDRETTERQIAKRHHTGNGWLESGDKLQLSLEQIEQLREIEQRRDC